MLQGNRIVHSDLNAIIVLPEDRAGKTKTAQSMHCDAMGPGSICAESYREFTVIFHDELKAVQAFPELDREDSEIRAVRDGMGINYGAAGMGSIVLASRAGKGPAAQCAECKLEEFFLSSWANGDPALLVGKNKDGQITADQYPDDPSNVHHSYMGDPVRFVNLHAGPKETHVFHLHAHQWVQDKEDDNSVYLDSQTISPGASFSYDIHYGGSGNRNFTPGDSIFHCHLYPHFAQGMWELWRSHDVFEDGSKGRYLPDGEIKKHKLENGEEVDGTPNPALIPVPRRPLPPLPTAEFKGYPFYIPGLAGHRAPQPPYDMAVEKINGSDEELNGGLPRHIIVSELPAGDDDEKKAVAAKSTGSAKVIDGEASVDEEMLKPKSAKACSSPDLYERGRCLAAKNAERVKSLNGDEGLLEFARKLDKINIKTLPSQGTPDEQRAMDFHAGKYWPGQAANAGARGSDDNPGFEGTTPQGIKAVAYKSFDSDGHILDTRINIKNPMPTPRKELRFWVNGKDPQPGAPFADPCPAKPGEPPLLLRKYRAAYIQFDLTVNKAGWHDPQARIAVLERDVKDTFSGSRPAEPLFFRANSGDCVDFRATNLVPSNLNLDDFQVFSPTDIIGQHIHLVKFDVTSSDGSANGWNYEDGTFSADEVRERIKAYDRFLSDNKTVTRDPRIKLKTHPMFLSGGALYGDARGLCADQPGGSDDNPFCGAQTTVQRWWADPLYNKKNQDRTLQTVFTHDHFGPSSHQHHGLYAALIIEPKNAEWQKLTGAPLGGPVNKPIAGRRDDGGPTSYAANIIASNDAETRREFGLAFADFAIVYSSSNEPINAPNRVEKELPWAIGRNPLPAPEGISAEDPGTQLINYRNEPIPFRIGQPTENGFAQKEGAAGELANVFSSKTHANSFPNSALKEKDFSKDGEPLTAQNKSARQSGDPATPLLMAYEGDKVQLRLIQGAQEEQHVFTMHGVKWLAQSDSQHSGYMNAQQIGISEHFEFGVYFTKGVTDTDYLYSSNATDNLWDGQWGLMRVFRNSRKQEETGLAHLPWNTIRPPETPTTTDADNACDAADRELSVRRFTVSAWLARDLLPEKSLVYNRNAGITDPNAIIFVKDQETYNDEIIFTGGERLLREGLKQPEPLILRAAADECIKVELKNHLPQQMPDGPNYPDSWSWNMLPPIVENFNFNQVRASNRVGLHPQLLAVKTKAHDGANVGLNKDSTRGPGESIVYNWYAGARTLDAKTGQIKHTPIEFGATALVDLADVIKHSSHGAIGSLIIEPKGSRWDTDGNSGSKANCRQNQTRSWMPLSDASADVCDARGNFLFREFALLYQDDLSLQQGGEAMPNLSGADDSEDSGLKGFNYRTEPLWARFGLSPDVSPEDLNGRDFTNVFSSKTLHVGCNVLPCDPATPIFTAKAGQPVRFRLVHPAGHPRQHGFSLFGHNWYDKPWNKDSSAQDAKRAGANLIGSFSGIGPARHLNILTTAGGAFRVPGDYMYRSQESFQFSGGLWGIFRVEPKVDGAKNSRTRQPLRRRAK